MLDNIVNSLKRGVERARVRGEEVTQATRLRFEIYQLNRELDALYGRLGRAYHSGADLEVLQPIRDDIRRVDDEISARERLIVELGAHVEAPAEDVTTVPHDSGTTVVVPDRAASSASGTLTGTGAQVTPQPAPTPADRSVPGTVPTPPASVIGTPGMPSAASVYQAKRQEETMAADEQRYTTDESGLTPAQQENSLITDSLERNRSKDEPNQDYQERVDEGQRVSQGSKTDASLHGSDAPIPPIGTLAGNAQGIDRAPVTPNVDTEKQHQHNLGVEERDEAQKASRDPDPLDR